MTRRHPWLLATALLLVPACSTSGSDAGSDGRTSGGDRTTTTTAATTTEPPVDPDADPDEVLVDAVDATLEARSFTVESEAELTFGAQDFRLGTSGSIDYEDVIGDMTLEITQAGSTTELGVRADGDLLWIKADEAEGVDIPAGKSWVEGDATELTRSDSFQPVNLIGVILALRGAEGAEVGETDTVNGAEATQYTVTIDYDDAVEATGDDREAFNSALSLTSPDPIELTIDVWVGNEDGVIRRFLLETDAGKAPLDATYRIDLSAVNEPVTPPDPPEDSTVFRGPKADEVLTKLLEG